MIRQLIAIGLVASAITSIQLNTQQPVKSIRTFENTCKDYNIQCSVKVLKHQGIQAYANADNEIFISQGILKTFPEKEVRAIFFHEMSHLLLGHPNVAKQYYTGELKLMKESFNDLRRTQEFAADATATHLLILQGYSSSLDEALLRLSDGNMTQESTTHPSIKDRVQKIQQIEKQYCK